VTFHILLFLFQHDIYYLVRKLYTHGTQEITKSLEISDIHSVNDEQL